MYHIVRMNERIEMIAKMYNIELDEIKSCNHHIRDWDHLIPGTKLLLPSIPEALTDELNDVEPFIEEYYPKISSEETYNEKLVDEGLNESNNVEPKVDNLQVKEPTKQVNKTTYPKSSIFYNGYYPFNVYPNPYVYPYFRKQKKSKK